MNYKIYLEFRTERTIRLQFIGSPNNILIIVVQLKKVSF